MNWDKTALQEHIQEYNFLDNEYFETHYTRHPQAVRLLIELEGLADYTECWGEKSGVWLILAVLRMLHEILEDYRHDDLPFAGIIIPDKFMLAVDPENEQEIGHRILTAYNEIYDVLVRVHSQSKTRIWNRRAAIGHFPQLTLTFLDTHNIEEE